MFIAVISGFIVAFIAPAVSRMSRKYAGTFLSLLPLGLFIYFASFIPEVSSGTVYFSNYQWVPSLGIGIDLYLDGLSLIFSLIITGVGWAVFFYAGGYMSESKDNGRFYVYLLIFMSSMLGLVNSDNIILMFIFWELTSISSYFLIGFKHEDEESRKSAWQALLITALGGLALLAGLVLTQIMSGTWRVTEILFSGDALKSHYLYPPATILIFAGAFTKSAQFPFHFWLPNAMAAPTPVSAYLHSATMVKAGVYLLARFSPAFNGTALWHDTLIIIGGITMLWTALTALKQTDLKRLLAYSTTSVLGTLVMLIGIGTEIAIKAMIIYLMAHALYKGALFLYAGIVDHETGTRDITKLGGLRKFMPVTAVLAILAAFSKMGIIPFLGFIGKETLYEAALGYKEFGYILIFITVLSAICIVAVSALVALKPMYGKEKYPAGKPHEPEFRMWVPPVILAFLGFLFAILSDLSITPLVTETASIILLEQMDFHIKLWHGLNLVFFLSMITLAAGILTYIYWEKIKKFIDKFSGKAFTSAGYWYDKSLKGMLNIADFQTSLLQNGYLRYYIFTIVMTAAGLAVFTYFLSIDRIPLNFDYAFTYYETAIFLMILGATIYVMTAKGRLSAVAGLGIVGYGIVLIYVIFSAPDLALTQFAIETLTVILFIFVIYKLPKFSNISNKAKRFKDLALALTVGTFVTLLILYVTTIEKSTHLKEFFAKESYIAAKGKNIVNVILVDFRALDTMGEITVLAIAALGVYALIKLQLRKGEKL